MCLFLKLREILQRTDEVPEPEDHTRSVSSRNNHFEVFCKKIFLKVAKTYVRYFARIKLLRGLVHKKKFGLLFQLQVNGILIFLR